MKQLSDVFLYLERTYLISEQNHSLVDEDWAMDSNEVRNLSPVGHTSFWHIGLKFLRQNLGQIELKDKLVSGILNLITSERTKSETTTREIIKRLVHILLALNLYKEEFEPMMFSQSKSYYLKLQLKPDNSLS